MPRKEIIIENYNPIWKDLYQNESLKIIDILKDKCSAIYHVGSTSVPGLAAKPNLDVIVVLKNVNDSLDSLKKLNYKFKGEINLPLRYFFSKRESIKFLLHVHEEGSAEIDLNLKFRDTLIKNPKLIEQYANLKRQNAKHIDSSNKTSSGITLYNLGKNDFINRVIEMSGFNGLCPRLCTQDIEWEYYNNVNKQLQDDNSVEANSEISKKYDPEVKRLVLYKGTKIVMASRIYWNENNVEIGFMESYNEINNLYPNNDIQNYKNFLVDFIERWAKRKGKILNVV